MVVSKSHFDKFLSYYKNRSIASSRRNFVLMLIFKVIVSILKILGYGGYMKMSITNEKQV